MRQFRWSGYERPLLPTFSPCGRWLFGTGGSVVVAWDLTAAGADPAWEDSAFGAILFRLAVSPCGRYLAGSEDRCVLVWDLANRGEPKWLSASPAGDHILDVAFAKNGDLLTACLGGEVRRWRTESWRRKPAFARRANCDGPLAVSPNGRTVATAAAGTRDEFPRIKLWDYPSGAHRKTGPRSPGPFRRLAFSPDGVRIATDEGCERVRLWDARTLKPTAAFVPAPGGPRRGPAAVHGFAFHPSGKYLAVIGRSGRVELVDTANWQSAVTYDWKLAPLYGVAFSRDGTLAAVGDEKGRVVVWDVDL